MSMAQNCLGFATSVPLKLRYSDALVLYKILGTKLTLCLTGSCQNLAEDEEKLLHYFYIEGQCEQYLLKEQIAHSHDETEVPIQFILGRINPTLLFF